LFVVIVGDGDGGLPSFLASRKPLTKEWAHAEGDRL
jgi:hypothetical protein